VAFALAIAASGLSLLIAVLGRWERLDPKVTKNAAVPG